jgi:hypothetical protein
MIYYKNKYYQVVGVGRDTDKLEKYIIYKSLYDDPCRYSLLS